MITDDDTPCPFCPDGHAPPQYQNWAVILGEARDTDGQPMHLIVCKVDMSHVSESDAQWLRTFIRERRAES
jgi:hypothetical protein